MPQNGFNGSDPDWLEAPRGRARFYNVPQPYADAVWERTTDWTSNLVVYEWAAIVGNLLNGTGLSYRVGGMYLEFDNGGSAVDPTPTFDRTRDISYYNALSGDRDYLRVGLTSTQLTSSDETLFPSGNKCTFFSRSAGTTGVHSKAFGTGSIIIGASLVAYVDATDATQDLILSSMYFDVAEQQEKLSTSQIGLEWELTLQ